MVSPRIGLWLVGARGGVASTATLGLCALQRKLIGNAGLVSELPRFAGLELAAWESLVVGGHEIRAGSLRDSAMELANTSRAIDRRLVDECRDDLAEIDRRIRPGVLCRSGTAVEQLASLDLPQDPTPRECIRRLQRDLAEFIAAEGLEHLVLVNVASTEPPVNIADMPSTWAEMDTTLDDWSTCPLPASSLYAIAAIEMGLSAINFTPSLGSSPPAIDDLARQRKARHMGCDGKTGETLMKSVLAPMFRQRNLHVMSWVGHNIFGNLDGVVLNDPANKASKVASKDHLIGEILGYRPQTLVSIEYIESLGDWKTAWDHIHFTGFLDTPMTLQFIWQGCDSLLAGPLVLDLARFTDKAWRRGEIGLMTFLASFFKSPYGVTEHDFTRQFQALEAWMAGA